MFRVKKELFGKNIRIRYEKMKKTVFFLLVCFFLPIFAVVKSSIGVN